MKASQTITSPTLPAAGPGMAEYAFWAFLFVAIGRINQLIPGLSSLPLAKIVMGFAILAGFKSRGQLAPLVPDARALTGTAMFVAAIALALTPTSYWHGASLIFVTTRLPVIATAVYFAGRMRSSWSNLRGTFLVLVLCGVALARGAVSGYSGGRAADADTMYDPNDLAYLLVTLVPLAAAFLISAKSNLYRGLFGFATAILVIALLLTQSRGGLLGFITVTVLMTLVPMKAGATRSGSQIKKGVLVKLGTLVAVIAVGALVFYHLPESAQARFSTLLHIGSDYNLDPNDTTGRGDIWLRGIKAAQQRPWGYGPQTYSMVDLRFGGKFKAPHNSFLQALVELGALGLLLLFRMYYLAIRGLQRLRKRLLLDGSLSEERAEQALFARAIQFSLAGNVVSGFFLSEAYAEILWVTFGLCVALLTIAVPGSVSSDSVLAQQTIGDKSGRRSIAARPGRYVGPAARRPGRKPNPTPGTRNQY